MNLDMNIGLGSRGDGLGRIYKRGIMTKEELQELLLRYGAILNNSMIEYLNDLLELQFSVIREYITREERDALSELEVYQKIAIYNIYNRALNIFKNSYHDLEIYDDTYGLDSLHVLARDGNDEIMVFNYDYEPDYNSGKSIGDINLYKTICGDKSVKENLINQIKELGSQLENMQNEKSSSMGIVELQKKQRLEKKIVELWSGFMNEGATDKAREVGITGYYNQLFLNDYGLSEDSFSKSSANSNVLVKRLPNLKIVNNIKKI